MIIMSKLVLKKCIRKERYALELYPDNLKGINMDFMKES